MTGRQREGVLANRLRCFTDALRAALATTL